MAGVLFVYLRGQDKSNGFACLNIRTAKFLVFGKWTMAHFICPPSPCSLFEVCACACVKRNSFSRLGSWCGALPRHPLPMGVSSLPEIAPPRQFIICTNVFGSGFFACQGRGWSTLAGGRNLWGLLVGWQRLTSSENQFRLQLILAATGYHPQEGESELSGQPQCTTSETRSSAARHYGYHVMPRPVTTPPPWTKETVLLHFNKMIVVSSHFQQPETPRNNFPLKHTASAN